MQAPSFSFECSTSNGAELLARIDVDWTALVEDGLDPDFVRNPDKAVLLVVWNESHKDPLGVDGIESFAVERSMPTFRVPSEMIATLHTMHMMKLNVWANLVNPEKWTEKYAEGRANIVVSTNASPSSDVCSFIETPVAPIYAFETPLGIECSNFTDPIAETHLSTQNKEAFELSSELLYTVSIEPAALSSNSHSDHRTICDHSRIPRLWRISSSRLAFGVCLASSGAR